MAVTASVPQVCVVLSSPKNPWILSRIRSCAVAMRARFASSVESPIDRLQARTSRSASRLGDRHRDLRPRAQEVLQPLLVEAVAIDVGRRDHVGPARLAREHSHLAEEAGRGDAGDRLDERRVGPVAAHTPPCRRTGCRASARRLPARVTVSPAVKGASRRRWATYSRSSLVNDAKMATRSISRRRRSLCRAARATSFSSASTKSVREGRASGMSARRRAEKTTVRTRELVGSSFGRSVSSSSERRSTQSCRARPWRSRSR